MSVAEETNLELVIVELSNGGRLKKMVPKGYIFVEVGDKLRRTDIILFTATESIYPPEDLVNMQVFAELWLDVGIDTLTEVDAFRIVRKRPNDNTSLLTSKTSLQDSDEEIEHRRMMAFFFGKK